MKRLIQAAALALAVLPAAPLAAQDEAADLEQLGELFGGDAFAPEPLTAEQAARLPAATALVERLIPPGTMGEMMGEMFDGMLAPLMQVASDDPLSAVTDALGIYGYDVDMGEAEAAEVAAMLDPAWQERRRRDAEAVPALMNRLMLAIEPAIKGAMAEMYAIHFTDRELADIDAFFRTPSGAAYARKSFSMSVDPRLAGAIMQAMPAVFAEMEAVEAQMASLTADLPPVRDYRQLSKAERSRIAALTGLSESELAEALSGAGGE